MGHLRRIILPIFLAFVCLTSLLLHDALFSTRRTLANEGLLASAPTQPIGHYDYFGQLLSPQAAAQLVKNPRQLPNSPSSSQVKRSLIRITDNMLQSGEELFFERKLGDTFGLQAVLGFGLGLEQVQPELAQAIQTLAGRGTSNLRIQLQKPLSLGSVMAPAGFPIDTGFDVVPGGTSPIGLNPNGDITCAICHVAVSETGQRLDGIPNGDLDVRLLVALATNSAAGFARLNINPLDPRYQGNGKTIIDSQGQLVKLPDPDKFEQAFDDLVLSLPVGFFESSPDGINNTTQIPSLFTFGNQPYTAGGEFSVGPFAGLSSTNNGVHSSEINILAAAQLSAATLGIDPEVYLGVALQNAAMPSLRLPDGPPIQPSLWLRQIAPNPTLAELEDQTPAPGTGTYPNLSPSLFTFNGLVFSPDTNDSQDDAKGLYLAANNAMSVWQNSLTPPPNRTPENQAALQSGSVQRGAKVFENEGCISCHIPPFFTDNKIHPVSEIGTNPARGRSRLGLIDLLAEPQIYTPTTTVPPSSSRAAVVDVPTESVASSSTSLPSGLLPDGGYKTVSLRGLHLSAPYLHDGGVAVRQGALRFNQNGSFTVVDSTGLGLPGTLLGLPSSPTPSQPADSASSLRALVDRDLRAQVIATNQAFPTLRINNLDGTGHDFYVDRQAGFTARQQSDLVNFLLALDDNPSEF
ncbi:MAG: hypothetical protein AAGA83_13395 [Cyanobacteria bacterium P01_F01_bin.116]